MKYLFVFMSLLVSIVILTLVFYIDTPPAIHKNELSIPIKQKTEMTVLPLVEASKKKQNIEIIEFHKLIKNSLENLPTVAQMRKSIHYDPHLGTESAMLGGEILGKIATALKKNTALIPEGLKFYSSCAKDMHILFSIKAVCFRNIKDLNDLSLDSKTQINDRDYPSDIVQLANELPRN